MASTTESIGRLITGEVLLYGERQLLRNQDQPEQQPRDPPPPPVSAPLSHNDKAVASVLLTLLDEQLDISADRIADSGGAVAGRSSSTEANSVQNRVAAQYAEADAVFRPDLPAQQNTGPLNPSNQQNLFATTSAELRMAMQSAFIPAAGLVQSKDKIKGAGRSRQNKNPIAVDTSTLMRAGAGIAALAALVIVFLVIFAR